jgi:hypothetical protein
LQDRASARFEEGGVEVVIVCDYDGPFVVGCKEVGEAEKKGDEGWEPADSGDMEFGRYGVGGVYL